MEHAVILNLDEFVYSRSEIIGMYHRICIDSVSGVCHFPKGSCLLGTTLQSPFSSTDLSNITWGMVNSSHSVTIQNLLLSFDFPDNTEDTWIADFSRKIDWWAYLLRDWLALLADGPTDSLWRIATTWVDQELDRSVTRLRYYNDRFHDPEPLSLWQWQHVLDHASEGEEPPIARNLIIKAERAAYFGRSREAVINAATAVELAITTGIRERLIELGTVSEVIQAILARTRMLGPRIDFAKKLNIEFPERINQDLVSIRNSVIHSGQTISDGQAWSAILIAREIVDKYEPLDPHCEEFFQIYREYDLK